MTLPVAADDSPTTGDSFTLDGVRVERLRAGRAGDALFIVPGLDGDSTELNLVVASFDGPQDVYALTPLPVDAQQRPVEGMARMAELMVGSVRQLQPAGPYRLAGYSFGALMALEMAQQLRASGETVEALFLIEAVFDERYWPRGVWLRALIRRTGRQLGRIVRMRPTRAVGEFRRRGVRLVQRVVRRKADAPDPLQVETSGHAPMRGHAFAAISGYRPQFYPGTMTLISSATDRQFGTDTVKLWAGYAEHLDIQRVDGDHTTIMQNPAATAVASVIDHRLGLTRSTWAGVRPVAGFERPLILTTMRWFSVARLAHAMIESGFVVSACRPKGHVLEQVAGLHYDGRLNRLSRLRSLVAAIRATEPDIILPDDERALVLLRRLYARARSADPEMAALVARSLGNIEDWPSIVSRTALATEAHALDIAAPDTAVIRTAAELTSWMDGRSLPIVLKTDGSWGGRGVVIVREAAQLRSAWRTISNPPRLPRALKRMVVNREAGPIAAWLRRSKPIVNAQQYVEGREAIVTVACVDGKVQALTCLEVVAASEARGPAAVVRIIDHPAMAEAARRLVGRFGLTGFCGFDFIITEAGEARLLELNPRVTPTCYLLVEGDYQRSRTIALFPAELVRSGEPGTVGVLDLPLRAPSLIHHGERIAARQHRPVARMARGLKRKLTPSKF